MTLNKKTTASRSGTIDGNLIQYEVTATYNGNSVIAASGKISHPTDAHDKMFGTTKTISDSISKEDFDIAIVKDKFSFFKFDNIDRLFKL